MPKGLQSLFAEEINTILVGVKFEFEYACVGAQCTMKHVLHLILINDYRNRVQVAFAER